nr:MAG TPA: nucleoid-associated protein [Caudoviricetes sp.]
MPTVKGNLMFVSSRAAHVSEVWVRAPRVRTHVEDVVTTGNDRFPVDGGEVSFSAVPGPAVLALISQGRAVDTIPILVGDAATQTLRQVVSAAKVADDATQREIEKLAAQAVELIDASTENAKKAQDGATRAETAASNAKKSESNASSSASEAKSSASSASSSASKAATSEQNAAKSASDAAASAFQSVGSATSAKRDADRAAQIAASTSWDGDKLTVNGVTSPSLTGPAGPRGPKGDRGDSGQDGKDGASAWADITGKPSTFPPSGHRHSSADISDASNDAGDPKFGGRVIKGRNRDGKIFYYQPPTEGRELANKDYVDSAARTAQSLAVTEATANITRKFNTISGEGWKAIRIGQVVQLTFSDWNGSEISLPAPYKPEMDARGIGYDLGTKTVVPIMAPSWGNVTALSPDASRIFGQIVYLLRGV